MKNNDTIAPALIALLLGLWLMAETLAANYFNPEQHWPGLIAAAGLCFLIGYLCGAGPYQLFLGTCAFFGGALLWPFTIGWWSWQAFPLIWPVFLVVAGAACLAFLAVSASAPWPLLVPGLGAVITGSAGLLFSLGIVSVDPLQQARLLWPALLIVTGCLGLLQLLWRGLSSGR